MFCSSYAKNFDIFWKPTKNSIRLYVQFKKFKTAYFWQFYPLIVYSFLLKMAKSWPYNFITPFERGHFKLPEKQKIFEIRHSKQMLCSFKDLQYTLYCWHFYTIQISSLHTFVLMAANARIVWYLPLWSGLSRSSTTGHWALIRIITLSRMYIQFKYNWLT